MYPTTIVTLYFPRACRVVVSLLARQKYQGIVRCEGRVNGNSIFEPTINNQPVRTKM